MQAPRAVVRALTQGGTMAPGCQASRPQGPGRTAVETPVPTCGI